MIKKRSGVKKCEVEHINFEDFNECLAIQERGENKTYEIDKKLYLVYTIKVNKKVLSPNDDICVY